MKVLNKPTKLKCIGHEAHEFFRVQDYSLTAHTIAHSGYNPKAPMFFCKKCGMTIKVEYE